MKQKWSSLCAAMVACVCLAATVVLAQAPPKGPAADEKSPKSATGSEIEPDAKPPARRPADPPLNKLDVPKHPTPPPKSALAKIIQSQTLRVCVRSDIPPFGYFSSNGLIGFDIQLARQLAMQLSIYYKKNLQVRWQVIEAGERISKLQRKRCDLVAASFSYTKARAKKVAFSKIYLETDKVAIASTSITRAMPVIALVRGTTNYAKGLKGAIRYFSNYKDIMHAMKNNEVDYVVTDRPMAVHMMRSVTKSFRLFKALPQKERYGLGLHRTHVHLLNAVNQALVEIAKSGRLAYLSRQWL